MEDIPPYAFPLQLYLQDVSNYGPVNNPPRKYSSFSGKWLLSLVLCVMNKEEDEKLTSEWEKVFLG